MYGWLPDVCDDASQVVTASRRLARLLIHEYNDRQIADGKGAWLTPVIVAWPDWLARLHASAEPGRGPARLNAHQSRVLWEQVLADVISDPHMAARGTLEMRAHPEFGEIAQPHTPLRYRDIDPPPLTDPPALGEATARVLAELAGVDAEELERLRAAEVIG